MLKISAKTSTAYSLFIEDPEDPFLQIVASLYDFRKSHKKAKKVD